MPAFLSRLFGPILTKFAVIMLSMAALTGAAVVISYMVFANFASSLAAVTNNYVPNLQATARLVSTTGDVRDGLTKILIARDQPGVGAANDGFTQTLSSLEQQLASLNSAETAELTILLAKIRVEAGRLKDARSAEFRYGDELSAMVVRLSGLGRSIEGTLTQLSDAANVQATVGASETIDRVEQTLGKLIDTDFASLQLLLRIRADINMASGVLISLSQSPPAGLESILRDLGQASLVRLLEDVPKLTEQETTQAYHEPIAAVFETYSETVAEGTERDPSTPRCSAVVAPGCRRSTCLRDRRYLVRIAA